MKNLWPKWLPYPISIVRATVVCGTFFLFIRLISSSIQDAVLSWHYGETPDELIGAVFLGWIIILPVAAFLHHWFMGISEENYYASHHIFVPGWKSLWEGVIALGAATLGFMLVGLLIPSSANFGIAFGFWFLVVAYTYHLGYLFNSWRGDRKVIKLERKAAQKKAQDEARAAKVQTKLARRSL